MHKILKKILKYLRNFRHDSKGRYVHYTFVVKKNRIISIGKNKCRTTHPKAQKYGHRFSCIHSELDAILKVIKNQKDLSKLIFINIRLGISNEFCMAKPCDKCINLLKDFGVKTLFYSNSDGKFIYLKGI